MRLRLTFKVRVVVLLLPSFSTFAQSVPQRKGVVFGTFSNMHYVGEGAGDVIGMELLVLPNMDSPYVVFQCAEGVPSEPIFISAKVNGPDVRFTVNESGGMCNGVYEGRAALKGITLREAKSKTKEFLRRKKSYWAQ